jgi:hypothetical protein
MKTLRAWDSVTPVRSTKDLIHAGSSHRPLFAQQFI